MLGEIFINDNKMQRKLRFLFYFIVLQALYNSIHPAIYQFRPSVGNAACLSE